MIEFLPLTHERCSTRFPSFHGSHVKQRLSTSAGLYLPSYRGYWTHPELSGLNILRDLNGVSIDSFLESSHFLGERRQLNNADIRTTVITGFSDEDVLYDI